MSSKKRNPKNKIPLRVRRLATQHSNPELQGGYQALKDINRLQRYAEEQIKKEGLTLPVMAGLFEEQWHYFDEAMATHHQLQTLACHAGCHWCCSIRVSVSPVEAIIIASKIVNKLPQNKWQEIYDRTNKLTCLDPTDTKAWVEGQVMCSLVDYETKLCTMYDVRPSTCRGHVSLDEIPCRDGYILSDNEAGSPRPVEVSYKASSILEGVDRAIRAQGLYAYDLCLPHALAILLQPNGQEIVDAWLAGEDVFNSARVKE